MFKVRTALLAAPLAAAIGAGAWMAGSQPAGAQQKTGVEVGVLTCESVEGTRLNLLIHSTVDIKCTFRTTDGKVEHYHGETGIALGVDLSWKPEEKIAFTVVSAGTNLEQGGHALAGRYFGGKASVAAGLGVGAAALIGGSDDNIGLQPIALEESRGIGIAGGLGYLSLEPGA